ncbi:hypothetical protein ACFYYB_15645 [Streptomyces sp. NPDC002886]|uniref:hypothetical protein n=1 Tax=Streptomyces sp. NPDC002886 TaxID=3364667 RepID=UPI0036B26C18
MLAVLGCVVLAGCGTRDATTGQALAGSVVPATSARDAEPSEEEFLRFMELMTDMPSSCAQEVADEKGVSVEEVEELERLEDLKDRGVPPEPSELPGWEDTPGPHSFADGGMDGGPVPVPLPSDVPPPPEPDPDFAPAGRYEEVALNPAEECFGADHVRRIGEAFADTKTGDYQVMRKKLTELGYPAPYIHRMPDHAGAPRVRVDLRVFGSRLALEVTGTGSGVSAEAFGASEEEGVNVADVRRKPKPEPEPEAKPKSDPKQGAPAS